MALYRRSENLGGKTMSRHIGRTPRAESSWSFLDSIGPILLGGSPW